MARDGKAHYRALREDFRRGHHGRVLANGEHVVARLADDPAQSELVAPSMLLVGASLTQVEHYREAVAWLEQGLARLADEQDPSRSTFADRDHAIGDPHWFHRMLADLYLLLGSWDRAAGYLAWLGRPEHPVDSRLAAARGQAALAIAGGNNDAAQWLVNTAADLARRQRSNFLEAMVEADRVMFLAAQTRLREATEFADAVGPRLAAPAPGAQQAWANAQATSMYTFLARRLAAHGDLMTAERYLLETHAPALESRRAYCVAQLELARAVVRREEGELTSAQMPLRDALRQFEALGTQPAVAIAVAEEAELARSLGLTGSSESLAARATAAFEALGMRAELDFHRARWRRLPSLGRLP
jgi:hypothetical protein